VYDALLNCKVFGNSAVLQLVTSPRAQAQPHNRTKEDSEFIGCQLLSCAVRNLAFSGLTRKFACALRHYPYPLHSLSVEQMPHGNAVMNLAYANSDLAFLYINTIPSSS
jgi:hypothetical protein